jgi:hypothetical protein
VVVGKQEYDNDERYVGGQVYPMGHNLHAGDQPADSHHTLMTTYRHLGVGPEAHEQVADVVPPALFAYGSGLRMNVPVFMGAGAVSVMVLIVEDFSPSRASFVPEAEIQVVLPEVRISPVPVAV